MKIAINWFASTGSFHRNGRTIANASKLPAQTDARCLVLAKADAEKFAASKGEALKEFSISLIGYYSPTVR